MRNPYCTKPHAACTRVLARVARGEAEADTVITGARVVNVCTRELLGPMDIAIALGRIALVGDARHTIGASTRQIDAAGMIAAPGFWDGHIHVESSMLTLGEYARAVVPHGTVGVVMDPHEMCNVLGLEGMSLMLQDAARTPLKVLSTVPSCVPSMSGFEDTGAAIGPDDVARAMSDPRVAGLGEMMNYPGILAADADPHAMVAAALDADKAATGHYPVPETGAGLNAYAASGLNCCHESTRAQDALERMRLGMYAMLREGSGWRDLHETAPALCAQAVDPRYAVLVSDDAHPHTLLSDGHMDHIVRRAVQEGIDPLTAIQMSTLNCAQCFGLDHDLGSITPGKCADIVLMDSLEGLHVRTVLIDGRRTAKWRGRSRPLPIPKPRFTPCASAARSMRTCLASPRPRGILPMCA